MVAGWSGGGDGNYAYACARVKARKSLLLPGDTYPRMLNMDLPEIGRFIGEGQYRREVDDLSARYSGVDLVEVATYLNLARTYRSILGFTKGELRNMVRLFLNRWDIWNFKTVLRGRTAGVGWAPVSESIIPAGAFDLPFFESLFAAGDMDEMAALLKRGAASAGFEPVLLKLIREHGNLPGLAELENALDKEYYVRMLGSVPEDTAATKLFRNYLRVEVDIVNLKTLFKLKFENAPMEKVQELLIEGGKELGGPMLRKLAAAEGFDAFLSELGGTRIFEPVREPAARSRAAGSLNDVLLALDWHLMATARRFSHIYPLSVLPVIDYLLRKKTEVDNLRTVARGKQSGLHEDEIRSLLVL
jgi:V/A-type H+-transporting ATPase subunit C